MKTKAFKIEQVKEISQALLSNQTLIFIDIKDLKVNELNRLRMILKKFGSSLKVVKKRLLKIAFTKNGLDFVKPQGQLGVIFSSKDLETIAPPIYKFFEPDNLLKINAGFDILNKKFLSADLIKSVGQLPSREVLMSQLLEVITRPLKMLLYVLKEKSKNQPAKT